MTKTYQTKFIKSSRDSAKSILVLEDDINRVNLFMRGTTGNNVTLTSSSSECIALLSQNSYDILFLDHDLGGETYVKSGQGKETGYDVALWLQKNEDRCPDKVFIHSLNEKGRKNMKYCIKNATEKPFAWMLLNQCY